MITPEEMNKLNALGKRFADSGNVHESLTDEEWDFVRDMADKLMGEHNKPLPDEN